MCILYNNFLRLSFDIPYMASDVVEAFLHHTVLEKHFKNQWQNYTYSYIVKIKVIPISYDSRFVYFIIFKIQNLWYFYCGVHQVWNWPSHLYRGGLRQPLHEILSILRIIVVLSLFQKKTDSEFIIQKFVQSGYQSH